MNGRGWNAGRPIAQRLVTLVAAECLVLWLLIALVPGVNGQLPSPPWDLFGAAALLIAIVTVIATLRADRGHGSASDADRIEAILELRDGQPAH